MPAKVRRLDAARLKRLSVILGDLKEGKSVQQIAAARGYEKHKVYQSMYYLKKLSLLPQDFKNPRSVYVADVAKAIKELSNDGH